jgi:hypothetical protein
MFSRTTADSCRYILCKLDERQFSMGQNKSNNSSNVQAAGTAM